jgi:hypothetical protein
MFASKGEYFSSITAAREELWKGGITGIVEEWIE